MLDDEFVNSLRKACLTCIRRHDECTLLDIATEIRDSVCSLGVADAYVPHSDYRTAYLTYWMTMSGRPCNVCCD
jgi:hypothetical protein